MGRKGRNGGRPKGAGPLTRSATTQRAISRARRGRPKTNNRPGPGRNSDESRSSAGDATQGHSAPPTPAVAGGQPTTAAERPTGPGSVELAPPGPVVQQTHGEDLTTGARPIVTVSATAPHQVDKSTPSQGQGAHIDLGVELAQKESCGPSSTSHRHGNQDCTTGGNLALDLVPKISFPSVIPRGNSQGWGFGPEREQTSSVINQPINGNRTGTHHMSQIRDGASGSGSAPQIHSGRDTSQETTPLRPQCDTLGVNVPTKLREKIWKEEFVDFNALLGDKGAQAHATGEFDASDQTGFILVQEGQRLALKRPNPKKQNS